jgi:hypothetical protein
MTLQAPSPLTVSAMTAYLSPLLQKHEKGQVLHYEDLATSLQAAESVLKQNEAATDFETVVGAPGHKSRALSLTKSNTYFISYIPFLLHEQNRRIR